MKPDEIKLLSSLIDFTMISFLIIGMIKCSNSNTSEDTTDNSRSNFEVLSTKFSLKLGEDHIYGAYSFCYEIKGLIKNLSTKTLNKYGLSITFKFYNAEGESFLKGDDNYAFNDGFHFDKKQWNPDEEIKFNLVRSLFGKDLLLYPYKKIEAYYSIHANDPFKVSFDELVGYTDITTEWHQAQEEYKTKTTKQ